MVYSQRSYSVGFWHYLLHTVSGLIGHNRGQHNRFRENVMLISVYFDVASVCAVTSRFVMLKRVCVKFSWMRYVTMIDMKSCCADEMDSLWQLKIMSFTQSAWEGIQLPFQLRSCWLFGAYWGQTSSAALQLWAVDCLGRTDTFSFFTLHWIFCRLKITEQSKNKQTNLFCVQR